MIEGKKLMLAYTNVSRIDNHGCECSKASQVDSIIEMLGICSPNLRIIGLEPEKVKENPLGGGCSGQVNVTCDFRNKKYLTVLSLTPTQSFQEFVISFVIRLLDVKDVQG